MCERQKGIRKAGKSGKLPRPEYFFIFHFDLDYFYRVKLISGSLGPPLENDFADYLYLILRHLSSTRVLRLF